MIPHDTFTPHGYLNNPYHSWKLNPSGVLRSMTPLGMGWHVPNLGSYVRNQFEYSAHLTIGLKVGEVVLMTPEDFQRHGCTISSHLHTSNRFAYTCNIPAYALTLTARYFLVQEHALGCIISLSTTSDRSLPVTCYLIHSHTHNPYTSRLWEHGWYACNGPVEGTALLGLASEGDAFVHGIRSADGFPLEFASPGYVVSLHEAADWASGKQVARPQVTQHQEDTGWQMRTLIVPCSLNIDGPGERILNSVLARGVSQDEANQRWLDGIEEIAFVESQHQADDEQFWSRAPQLSGDWPSTWRRGWVYDLETLRMTMRPPAGVLSVPWDGMQIQAPRQVLAEAAMDTLFLSYADPLLASEVILGHFESAAHPQVPCMREDGSYNMVSDDGQVCGTAPEWGFPLWCCDRLFLRTGDTQWLLRLYPRAAAYLRWWLEQRRDAEGWLVYACSWESGQDVSSRFGPQQTGGSFVGHVRPVDLQASMAQAAGIVARWAALLAEEEYSAAGIDFTAERIHWREVASEFAHKTRSLWHKDWFRDYDFVAREWSGQQDTMHLAPVFCDVAEQRHLDLLRPYFALPPMHSQGWAPLSWPPVAMTLIGAAAEAQMPLEAAELAYHFIDASYRSTDNRQLDAQNGLPGVTREYLQAVSIGENAFDYTNAGIEGYGWGALSIDLLLRYLLGLREIAPGQIMLAPMLPQPLHRAGACYRVAPVQWGKYALSIVCTVRNEHGYTLHVLCTYQQDGETPTRTSLEWQWDGIWGEAHTLHLSQNE